VQRHGRYCRCISYTAAMKQEGKSPWNPARLDAVAFARAQGRVSGRLALSALSRLTEDLHDRALVDVASPVEWALSGELRPGAEGTDPDAWLHLQATASVPLTCQRCLGPVQTPLSVDRWFRMVADEAAAEAQDDDCEEDLLALEPLPNMVDVLEDEFIMGLPLVPMHDDCPQDLVNPAEDRTSPEVEPEKKPHPFAALAGLKKAK